MPNLTAPILLDAGVPQNVSSGVVGTGVTKAQTFCPPVSQMTAGDAGVTFSGILTGAFTVLSFDIEVDHLGDGTNWVVLASWDAFVNKAKKFVLIPGRPHRLNCKSFTGGTSAEVIATAD